MILTTEEDDSVGVLASRNSCWACAGRMMMGRLPEPLCIPVHALSEKAGFLRPHNLKLNNGRHLEIRVILPPPPVADGSA
ncbi:hypothetical protein ACNKHS_02105 [Shigella flexneri]